MKNECSYYYAKVIEALLDEQITDPAETFWAGVFVGICEQVMMQVKPAGMVSSDMPRCEEITRIISTIYSLHLTQVEKRGSKDFEMWVCRKDDRETIEGIQQLGQQQGMDWGEYHQLRGRLCGYSEQLIRTYTEGVWP